MAAKNKKLEAWASHLYINDGWKQKAIAEYLEVSENTVSKWKAEGMWDAEKARVLASPLVIKQLLLKELESVSSGAKSKIDADALSKITKALESIDDKTSPQVIHSVFKEFDLWMSEEDPKITVEFMKWHKKYLIYKINIDG